MQLYAFFLVFLGNFLTFNPDFYLYMQVLYTFDTQKMYIPCFSLNCYKNSLLSLFLNENWLGVKMLYLITLNTQLWIFVNNTDRELIFISLLTAAETNKMLNEQLSSFDTYRVV